MAALHMTIEKGILLVGEYSFKTFKLCGMFS